MPKPFLKLPVFFLFFSILLLGIACGLMPAAVETQPAVLTPVPPSPVVLTLTPTSPPTEQPTPTQAEPTASPVPTELPPEPELPLLDQSDLTSVMAWMNVLLKTRAAEEIDQVVGPQGTLFAPYAVGAFPPGYDNGLEIASELEKAFVGAEPACLGYDPNIGTAPDKAALFVQGLNFDWPALGLPAETTGVTTFQFFNLDGLWQLTFIVPMPDWGLPDFSTLQPCP